jgi:hypothetical protein
MTLQACNLIMLHKPCACSSNQDSLRSATAQSEQQNKVEYMYACSRVDAVRHIPWSLYLAVLATQHVAQTLCSQKQHKTRRWQQAGNCTARVAQRSGIDVPIPMGWTHQTDAAGCTWLMACCTNPVHTAVFRSNSGCLTNLINLLVHVCTYACLFVC